ncbi:MAG: RNA 2'-phosphotransferase [Moraxella equi]|nr:RNA 2'-phosphotransferase [Moraxella equi]
MHEKAGMNDKEVSRFLSRVLRHKPELIGIVLDEQGYTDIETLIKNACEFGKHFDHAQLLAVVANNDKQRYQISDDGTQIRAVQGHSHPVSSATMNHKPRQTYCITARHLSFLTA